MSWLDAWRGTGASAPLTTPTYDGSGQTVHPDVVDTVTGWNGYRYWMGITPYPDGNDDYENPSILASADGNTWVVPAGLTNPIAAPGAGFWPDPDLVFDGTRLHYFWAGHRYSYSDDGITWSSPVQVVSPPTLSEVSPAVVVVDGTWMMWAVDVSASPNKLFLRTASGPTGPWSAETECDIEVAAGRDVWHLDVCHIDGEYWSLLTDCTANVSGADAALRMAHSYDGVEWEVGTIEVIPRTAGTWAATHLYRSSMIPIFDDGDLVGFDVWYSARSAAGAWRTGRTTIEP